MKLPAQLLALTCLLMSPNALPAADAADTKTETAVLGGGCFWCTEAQYKMLHGVKKVVSGYTGGKTENPTYEDICTGETGHAEVIQIEFDPAVVTYAEILEFFWLSHDPTTVTREPMVKHGKVLPAGTPYQGNDYGTQYRSCIFYLNEGQKAAAETAKKAAQKDWEDPIATEIAPLGKFYPAEDYHQDYFAKNPNAGYCRVVVSPKVAKFRQKLLEKGKIKEGQ